MNDVDLNNNPEPFYPCRNLGCAQETSYPVSMLAMHPKGGVVCETCWGWEPDELDVIWADLPGFVPSTS